MRVRLLCIGLILFFVTISGATWAAEQGFTTLDVNGDQVTIYRDEFGVPHTIKCDKFLSRFSNLSH